MSGISVYCEIGNQGIESSLPELVSVAKNIKAVTKESICLLLIGNKVSNYLEEIKYEEVDEIYFLEIPKSNLYATDVLSTGLSQMIEQIAPSCILVPATQTARAIFSRVAVKLEIGMTADCMELEPYRKEGRNLLKQMKPSYGSQIMVSCEELKNPQLVTVRTGGFDKALRGGNPTVHEIKAQLMPETKIRQIQVEKEKEEKGIQDAKIVVCVGRGSLEGKNFELAEKFAKKIGAVLAGTRPMADQGWLPFENQIGQTGCVIRPKVCITFGVSGAIQFTEGIKGNPLLIAVNTDANAPIFNGADYAVVMDMQEILQELLV